MSRQGALARTALADLLAARRGVNEGDAIAIHRMRIAIAQLRANAAFFARLIPEAGWDGLKADLRWLNRMLGRVRDIDVTLTLLPAVPKHRRASLGTRLGRQRVQSLNALREVLRSQRFQTTLVRAAHNIERGDAALGERQASPSVSGEVCRSRMRAWLRRLRKRGARLHVMNDDERHRLRIRAKRARYMLRALAPVLRASHPKRFRQTRNAVLDLQRALGDLRDLERLQRVLGKSKPRKLAKKTARLLARAQDAVADMKQI